MNSNIIQENHAVLSINPALEKASLFEHLRHHASIHTSLWTASVRHSDDFVANISDWIDLISVSKHYEAWSNISAASPADLNHDRAAQPYRNHIHVFHTRHALKV